MSQQLNLLSDDRQGVGPVAVALVVWALVVLGLFSLWGVNQFRLAGAREAEAVAARELTEARAVITQREDRSKALVAEIEALKPVSDAARQLLALADGLGKTQGYAEYFSVMAGAVEPNLWLTDVDIGQAGKTVRVEGYALDNGAIMRFGHNLNAVFAERGLKFVSLEMQPQTFGDKAAETPPVNATKFVFK
ncbi:MAG: hypothetical protein Q8M20_15540 [Rhodocyclaceae bacterium]|nr:hypothetical protein [Rhodocyclaceae bacterium]MDZ4215085.1 hypothetical protein [Rhodocyclaceae bacterium]